MMPLEKEITFSLTGYTNKIGLGNWKIQFIFNNSIYLEYVLP